MKCCPYCVSKEIRKYDPFDIKDKLGPYKCHRCYKEFMKPSDHENMSEDRYYHWSVNSTEDFLKQFEIGNLIHVCFNRKEWFSEYNEINTLVTFTSDVITHEHIHAEYDFDSYHNLLILSPDQVDESIPKNYVYSDKLLKLIEEGKTVFVLDIDNDQGELSEMFIINPKENLKILKIEESK